MNYVTHPYPEELAYSTIARFQRNMNISSTKAANILFSQHMNVNNLESGFIVTKLDKLAQKYECDYSGEKIITDNTTFRYDTAFYSDSLKEKAKDIYLKGGQPFKRFKHNYLRYCPKCLINDINNYGEPFFHVLHQLDGIFICPTCHTPLYIYESDIVFDYICLNDPSLNKDYDFHIPPLYYEIADMSKQLINDEFHLNFENTKAKIITLLKEIGAWKNRTISKSIIPEIQELYKTNEVIELYYGFSIEDICDEIPNVCLAKNSPVVSTITYLILIHYLSGSLAKFDEIEVEISTTIDKKESRDAKTLKRTNKTDLIRCNNTNTKDKHMRVVEDLIREGNLTRKMLYTEYKATYKYLTRHENEWLNSKLPKPLLTKKIEYKIEEDLEVKKELQKTYEALIESKERVYIGNFKKNKEIRVQMRKIHHYPIAKAYFDTVIETNEQYYRRIIRRIIDELISKDEILSYYKILESSINDWRKFDLVKSETDIYLKERGFNNIRLHNSMKTNLTSEA